jgi:hypothetical protein
MPMQLQKPRKKTVNPPLSHGASRGYYFVCIRLWRRVGALFCLRPTGEGACFTLWRGHPPGHDVSREQGTGTGQISGRPLFAAKLAGNTPSFPKVACQTGKRRSTRGKLLPFKRPSSARRHATTSPSARISPAKRRFLPRPPTAFHVQCQSPDHHPHR